MARVFVTRDLPGAALDRLGAEHDVDLWPQRLPPPPRVLRERTRAAHGLLCLLTDRVDAELIAASPDLVAISNYATGTDNVDVEAATDSGIPVGHTPDVLTDATADLTFALLLAAARRLPEAQGVVRAGRWMTWEPDALLGLELAGATLGIVGMGRIGTAVARRAEAFGMHVVGVGRSDPLALPELLAEADVVSLHCPLTSATRELIDDRTLDLMRPSAILINTARGELVDQHALARALRAGRLAAAALDVTDPEPLDPRHPLLEAPNVIVVPHIGSATRAAREGMAEMAVDNLLAGLDGRPMPHAVNGRHLRY